MDQGDFVMGGVAAVWGGFSTFFSIWQICLLQISPFFVAFIVGIYLATQAKNADSGIRRWLVPLCITYTIGFIIFFSLLIASGLTISRPLIHNIVPLRVVSGFIILLASLYIFLVNRIPSLGKIHRPATVGTLSLLLGVCFALIYSPCITPMLSDIMGIASQRSTAAEGWYLAFCYALGTCIALSMTSVALIMFAGRRDIVLRNARLIMDACGAILLILAAMNITGLMRHYKAFVL